MNFSTSFKDAVYALFHNNDVIDYYEHSISEFDKHRVFCYVKNVDSFHINSEPEAYKANNSVKALYGNTEHLTVLNKPEDAFRHIGNTVIINKIQIDDSIYYASRYCIFNSDKNPILFNCVNRAGAHIACLDFSILKESECPISKFLIKKVIPFFIEQSNIYYYAIMDCDKFIIKPTCQGELDHTLVSDFLCNKFISDFGLEKKKISKSVKEDIEGSSDIPF